MALFFNVKQFIFLNYILKAVRIQLVSSENNNNDVLKIILEINAEKFFTIIYENYRISEIIIM